MPWLRLVPVLFVLTLLSSSIAWCTETEVETKAEDGNLILDGGFEEIEEADATTGYLGMSVKSGVELGGKPFARVPRMLNQFSGAKKFIIVQGQPGKEIHSGKYALLVNGNFHLNARPESSLAARKGDVFEFSCYARGRVVALQSSLPSW